ncbi:kinase-like domain-containing protein [Limtongia smithiae]|uniref:kinase-like domain-containing protein n=1 Tax=Limtongia smithiae TaxID=1125753 RepID=UPI0034CE3D06
MATIHPRPVLRRRSTGSNSGSDHEAAKDIASVDYTLDNALPFEQFKREILLLTHKLNIPRWRTVPVSEYSQLKVVRISGALTNAVYCVTPPPRYLYKHHFNDTQTSLDPLSKAATKVRPIHVPEVLLRVYGPNTAQIIDRETELAVLTRLAAKNIGPRLLGIFTNGRFEQFLKATTLSKEDIREPDVSRAIAKRMRELHDNVKLTLDERLAGPGVWKNFKKWQVDAKQALDLLDRVADALEEISEPKRSHWTTKKILRTDWATFMEGARRYREWLDIQTGGASAVEDSLVFAHNDAQYGNLLRIEAPSGSPLLRPANEHRMLVVIDFEYASPNVRGYDISNHFCEWMSDYHHPERAQDIHSEKFPNQEEQLRFIESYVTHGIESYDDMDKIEREIKDLHNQTMIWRPAIHLGWCMWGIISAPLPPEVTEDEDGFVDVSHDESEDLKVDAFDYFDYASQKASLFWGEMASLSIPIPDGVDMRHAMYVGKPCQLVEQV